MAPKLKSYRRFCFTLNNPTEEHVEHIRSLFTQARESNDSGEGASARDVDGASGEPDGGDREANAGDDRSPRTGDRPAYLCYQREVGESGTPHLQGYLRYGQPVRMARVIRDIPGAHISPCKGSEAENIAYCSKKGTGEPGSFVEFGVRARSGQRNDLRRLEETIKAGASARELFDRHGEECIKHGTSVLRWSRYYTPRRNYKTEVHWYWGPTGAGKSRRANELYPSAYWKPEGKWWDGYDSTAHDAVIIDDYRCSHFTFSELLRLLDRYPHSVESKGASCEFLARTLIITAPKPPQLMWMHRTAEDLQQLVRRVEHTRYFSPDADAPQEGYGAQAPEFMQAYHELEIACLREKELKDKT